MPKASTNSTPRACHFFWQVLGGRVEALAEPWEFQRKYGTLDRSADASTQLTDERPPSFTPYVPGKTRTPHTGGLADIYNATLADQAAAAAAQDGSDAAQPGGQTEPFWKAWVLLHLGTGSPCFQPCCSVTSRLHCRNFGSQQ